MLCTVACPRRGNIQAGRESFQRADGFDRQVVLDTVATTVRFLGRTAGRDPCRDPSNALQMDVQAWSASKQWAMW